MIQRGDEFINSMNMQLQHQHEHHQSSEARLGGAAIIHGTLEAPPALGKNLDNFWTQKRAYGRHRKI